VVQARAQSILEDWDAAIDSLKQALEISEGLKEHSGDVDTLGHLADIYVDKNDLERASKLYDQVIAAIQEEEVSAPLTSSWDC
jgi:tetratricopeptide (TPR) repeat protein